MPYMEYDELPTWEEADAAVDADTASPLLRFISENEPVNAEAFRRELVDVINDAVRVALRPFISHQDAVGSTEEQE